MDPSLLEVVIESQLTLCLMVTGITDKGIINSPKCKLGDDKDLDSHRLMSTRIK